MHGLLSCLSFAWAVVMLAICMRCSHAYQCVVMYLCFLAHGLISFQHAGTLGHQFHPLTSVAHSMGLTRNLSHKLAVPVDGLLLVAQEEKESNVPSQHRLIAFHEGLTAMRVGGLLDLYRQGQKVVCHFNSD